MVQDVYKRQGRQMAINEIYARHGRKFLIPEVQAYFNEKEWYKGCLLYTSVSITIDEEFVVHDIKVIEGEKGLFIAMPSRKATDGEYRDIAHPINSATRDRIQNIILEKYEEVMAAEPEEAGAEE